MTLEQFKEMTGLDVPGTTRELRPRKFAKLDNRILFIENDNKRYEAIGGHILNGGKAWEGTIDLSDNQQRWIRRKMKR
jgi:hypothetical protein